MLSSNQSHGSLEYVPLLLVHCWSLNMLIWWHSWFIFIQNFNYLCTPTDDGFIPRVSVNPDFSFSAARKAVAEIKDRLEELGREELVKISKSGQNNIHSLRFQSFTCHISEAIVWPVRLEHIQPVSNWPSFVLYLKTIHSISEILLTIAKTLNVLLITFYIASHSERSPCLYDRKEREKQQRWVLWSVYCIYDVCSLCKVRSHTRIFFFLIVWEVKAYEEIQCCGFE